MHNKKHFFLHAGPLLLVLLIDGMGLGLMFPILNALMLDPMSGFFTHFPTHVTPNFMYGATIGLYMLCWFVGAAVLGDLSDQIGRKKSLLICLTGAFLGYLIGAMAIEVHSFSLLIFSRVIAGLTSGSQPIAQAAIADLSVQEHKTRNMGFIFLALSLGFVLGPLLGGVLSNPRLVSWFNFSTAFYFAALIALLNVILLWILFKDTYTVPSTKIRISVYRPVEIFVSAFKSIRIRNLAILQLIFILGWSSFFSFLAMFLFKKYGFTPTAVGSSMAVMGLGFSVGNGFLVNYVSQHFTPESSFKYCSLLSAGLVLMMLIVHYPIVSWLIMAPLAAVVAVAYATLLSLFSNQVTAHEQGWVMGITGSIMALVWGIDGFVIGAIAAWSVNLPMIIATLSLGLAGLLTRSLCPIKLDSTSNITNRLNA